MAVLVVGGAGYIGSHMVRRLVDLGRDVVVFDNLSKGHHAAVSGVEIVEGDLLDPGAVEKALSFRKFEGVYHFAALCYVGESVLKPDLYWRNNVTGTLNLLDAMAAAETKKIVFSSTAAVYGQPDVTPIPETAPRKPVNPYGRTKFAIEDALADYSEAFGIKYAALRYFNAAGASTDGSIGEDHDPETHLIPLVLQAALGKRKDVAVFGTDYPTPDGTCVRDYIHVEDLARAHVAAFDEIDNGNVTVNLGNGNGYSVREIIECARRVAGREIEVRETGRRPGDPPVLVASNEKARDILGWEPEIAGIEDIIETAWKWHKANPDGYRD